MSSEHSRNPEISEEEIKKVLDVSATKNRNLFIFFYIFSLYILISTLGTTDLALLLPQKSFNMPFIEFELDLFGFYILGPILLLAFHFNVLFNYYMHLEKLYSYKKVKSKDEVNLISIDPSLYDFAFSLENRGFSGVMINLFLVTLLYLLPILVFFIIYLRFADYHHESITPMHLFVMIVDLVFIVFSIIYNRKYLKHTQEKFSIVCQNLFLTFLGIIGFVGLFYFLFYFYPLVYDYDLSRLNSYYIMDIIFLSFFGLLVINNKKYFQLTSNDSKMIGQYFLLSNLGLLILAYFYIETKYKTSYLFNTCERIDDNRSIVYSKFIPRLVVTEEEMAKISPSSLYLPRFLNIEEQRNLDSTDNENNTEELTEKNLILNYGPRIDLSNRNLRCSDLKGSILARADFENSQLQYANLTAAQLQGTYLKNAQLQYANLTAAQLQGANLRDANLTGANLTVAKLENAVLRNTKLRCANLKAADLQGADLNKACLQYANLLTAKLKGASLNSADLEHVNMGSAGLEGADLGQSKLVDANLSNASLIGADLSDANLTGTNLAGANLAGADLSDANLTDTNLTYAFFIGADLHNANLRGANVSSIKLYNTDVRNTDFTDVRNVDFNKSITEIVKKGSRYFEYTYICEDVEKAIKKIENNETWKWKVENINIPFNCRYGNEKNISTEETNSSLMYVCPTDILDSTKRKLVDINNSLQITLYHKHIKQNIENAMNRLGGK